jgi:hypothetical protein
MIQSKYGKLKAHVIYNINYKHVLLIKSITEYGYTAESGSMEKEQTLPMMINLSDRIEI